MCLLGDSDSKTGRFRLIALIAAMFSTMTPFWLTWLEGRPRGSHGATYEFSCGMLVGAGIGIALAVVLCLSRLARNGSQPTAPNA